MVCYFGVQKFVYATLLIPLPAASLVFGFVCYKKFYAAFRHPALEVAACSPKEPPNMEEIYRSFIPPSLRDCYHKNDGDDFEDAFSQVSKTADIV